MLSPDTILQNRYRVVGKLGQGGMGTVYEVFDQRLHATIALKESVITNEHLQKQFEKEARLLAGLSHPALPKVFDYFVENDKQYLVMEFVPGEDLWTLMLTRRTPFSVEEVLRWTDQLLDALDYLHTQEPPVIHRDIKPHNLKITGRGQIKLLDFGLAKGSTGQLSHASAAHSVFGYTLSYAALEQIQGTGTDPRSDLYALASTLYHLLTASIPPDALTRITEVANEKPDPLRPATELNPQIMPAFSGLLSQAMSQNRDKRPASAFEMRQTLRVMTNPIVQSERPSQDLSQETLRFDSSDLSLTPSFNAHTAPTEKMDADSFQAAINSETVSSNFEQTIKADDLSASTSPDTVSKETLPPQTFLTGENTTNRSSDTKTFTSGVLFDNSSNQSANKKNILWITVAISGIILIGAASLFGIFKLVGWDNTNEAKEENQPVASASPMPQPGIDAKLPIVEGSPGTLPSPSTTNPSPTPKASPKPTQTNETIPTPTPAPEPPPTPLPTPKPIPKTISVGVVNGKAISLPKPAYPAAARAVNASGQVTVQVLIDENGNVVSASAVSGHPLLKASAVSAARSAKFSPTLLSGQPVKVSGVIVYNFVAN